MATMHSTFLDIGHTASSYCLSPSTSVGDDFSERKRDRRYRNSRSLPRVGRRIRSGTSQAFSRRNTGDYPHRQVQLVIWNDNGAGIQWLRLLLLRRGWASKLNSFLYAVYAVHNNNIDVIRAVNVVCERFDLSGDGPPAAA